MTIGIIAYQLGAECLNKPWIGNLDGRKQGHANRLNVIDLPDTIGIFKNECDQKYSSASVECLGSPPSARLLSNAAGNNFIANLPIEQAATASRNSSFEAGSHDTCDGHPCLAAQEETGEVPDTRHVQGKK